MNSLKLLSAAATVALVLPLASPSFAQQSRAAAVGAGGGAAIGGGGAAVAGGGGGFGGGARMGGGGAAFQGGGGGFGGGAAMRPGGGNFAAGGAVRPGGGSFVGGAADRAAISPSFSGTRSAAVAGNWQGGSGNWQVGSGNWSGRHWHGRHHHHHRHGGFWPGFAAGAAIGGLGSYAYYGSGYGYYDDPYYYGYYDEPSVAVVQDGGGDAAYCARRFKSYDPASGTYLGYDGRRHPCP
ncbi:BA14K-like protein [Bradyrhizobium yuanmingense]|uniref:Lectin-like protein BA14k n=1 Tax=Bradyrhizobium yuanmingense TaxID=108015 RepID=A0A1C3VVA2_9BRAD|nr:BA14K family protein [Bradyrhizobium yuanmingense]TWI29065.1 BA14K-like protein [Bradyrhizobium yuanmingense]SCB31617.1 BA14K-like protein [Bradyrhizobium yuanmingense]